MRLSPDTPRIVELDIYPLHFEHDGCDFSVRGDRELVAETCARDHANGCGWEYAIFESRVESDLWFVWQLEKGVLP